MPSGGRLGLEGSIVKLQYTRALDLYFVHSVGVGEMRLTTLHRFAFLSRQGNNLSEHDWINMYCRKHYKEKGEVLLNLRVTTKLV